MENMIFYFRLKNGKIMFYDPKAHGNYEILMQGTNLLVAKDGVPMGTKRTSNKPKKRVIFYFQDYI